jgi:hypothetical protein
MYRMGGRWPHARAASRIGARARWGDEQKSVDRPVIVPITFSIARIAARRCRNCSLTKLKRLRWLNILIKKPKLKLGLWR